MKIAIIGGTGFIGSYLVKFFIKKKIRIIATYTNKKKLFFNKNVKWKYLNIYKEKNYYKYLGNPDLVIHLSWGGLPNYNKISHIKHELNFQKSFIKGLISKGLKNIFISGTCYEYGKKKGKLNENMPTNPNNQYSKAKNELRKYLFKLKEKYYFNLTWGRIFYIYGKHNSRSTLYNQILESPKNNSVVNVQGNLIRDYLHINELVKLIYRISLKKNINIINICSGKGIRLKNLIKKICKDEDIKPNIIYVKNKISKYESNAFYGDSKKLRKFLK